MKTLQQLATEMDEQEKIPVPGVLTDEQVRTIRKALPTECHTDIAARVGCAPDQVSRVRNRKTYRWVRDDD